MYCPTSPLSGLEHAIFTPNMFDGRNMCTGHNPHHNAGGGRDSEELMCVYIIHTYVIHITFEFFVAEPVGRYLRTIIPCTVPLTHALLPDPMAVLPVTSHLPSAHESPNILQSPESTERKDWRRWLAVLLRGSTRYLSLVFPNYSMIIPFFSFCL